MKILIKKGAMYLAGSMLLVSSLWGGENSSKPVTLTMHHFLSSKAPPHTKLLEPWAKKVEEMSKEKSRLKYFLL